MKHTQITSSCRLTILEVCYTKLMCSIVIFGWNLVQIITSFIRNTSQLPRNSSYCLSNSPNFYQRNFYSLEIVSETLKNINNINLDLQMMQAPAFFTIFPDYQALDAWSNFTMLEYCDPPAIWHFPVTRCPLFALGSPQGIVRTPLANNEDEILNSSPPAPSQSGLSLFITRLDGE